jgi:phage shock protein PspC (stress-responsive transcriptional regulator)
MKKQITIYTYKTDETLVSMFTIFFILFKGFIIQLASFVLKSWEDYKK